jgi:hypothetical protein
MTTIAVTQTVSSTSPSTTARRLFRAVTVAGAALSSAAVFAVAHAAGTDFTITDPGQGKIPHTFVAPEIAIVTLVIGLAGWAALALLERWTRRPHLIWSVLAASVLVLSYVPIGIEVATTSTRIMLAVIHTVVAVALLPLLRWEATARND